MGRPVARYTPSRRYLLFAVAALCGALLSGWIALRWPPAWVPAAIFSFSALALLAAISRPPIEVHETHLAVGRRAIPWGEVRRVDQTGWNAPLALHLTLARRERLLVFHPGTPESSANLLRNIRRYSREALLDGIPYREFWGESSASPQTALAPATLQPAPPRYPLLRPEDEEEVERMFQRLKSVGRIDQRSLDPGQADEK